MAPRSLERRWAVVFAVALVLSVGGLYGYIRSSQPAAVAPRGPVVVTLAIEEVGWTLHYGPVSTTNNTVFGLLREASERMHFEVRYVTYTIPEGVLVTSINGTANGSGGRFWQYWVDGHYGDRAADRREITDGASVVWTFTIPQGGG